MSFARPALEGKLQDHRIVLAVTKTGCDQQAVSFNKALVGVAREYALAEA